MKLDLRGQVAIVTGAGRGIGRAIALRLTEAGCRVAGMARTRSELEETARAANLPAGESMLPIVADVTNDAELASAVRTVADAFGPIDILVNNAGYAPPRASVLKTPLADWDRTLSTCLRAPMVLSRLVLPDMLARRHGAIVNIASIAGKKARGGEAAYAAAKFGLLGFTHSLFAEVRPYGIKVAAVCPGLVDTAFIPPNKRVDRGQFLQPRDIADVVHEILCSPARACPTEIVIEPQWDPEQQ